MVFIATYGSTLLFALFAVWLTVITIISLRMIRRYNRLIEGSDPKGLGQVLETILRNSESHTKQVRALAERMREVEQNGELHVQQIGVVRFNPFMDTGGSQSFSIAILDMQESGVILTSLYGRAGNRWYAKEVHKGKGVGIELSKEEMTAIRNAKKKLDT